MRWRTGTAIAPRSADRPLRILFCTLGYAPGPGSGAEQQARLQAEELVRRGHSVTVVCPSSPGVKSGCLNGVRVQRLLWPHHWWYLREFTYLPALAGYLATHARKYDLVHVHMASRQADVAVLVAGALRTPVYVKVAGGGRGREIRPTKPVEFLTRHAGLRGAALVQAISDEIAGDLLQIGVAPDHIVRIPNGLATTHWEKPTAEERSEARRALNLPANALIALFAGRFAKEKGLRDLLDTWSATTELAQAKLVLVGEPAPDDPMEPIESSERVIVRGRTDQLKQYYWAADLFVLPSYGEGMSNTLLEAMCCGLPVVSTTVGAAPQMIDPGVNGFLIEPGDRAALSAVLRRLVRDPGLRERVGAAAAASVRDRFAIEGVVSQIERNYRSLRS